MTSEPARGEATAQLDSGPSLRCRGADRSRTPNDDQDRPDANHQARSPPKYQGQAANGDFIATEGLFLGGRFG